MLSTAQEKALEKLLQKDLTEDSLPHVAKHLEAIGEIFQDAPTLYSLLPFHEAYTLLIKSLAKVYPEYPHLFPQREALEQLEKTTAALYLTALRSYFLEKKKPMPWQSYLRYCEKPHGIPFVQLLLGFNSYLQGVLPLACEQIGFTYQKDFLRSSDFQLFELPHVMKYLAFADHSFFAMDGLTSLKTFMIEDFPRVLVRWRQDAWERYQLHLPSHAILQQTENSAHRMMHLFEHNITPKGIKEVTQGINTIFLEE